jgi:hypothetical protein
VSALRLSSGAARGSGVTLDDLAHKRFTAEGALLWSLLVWGFDTRHDIHKLVYWDYCVFNRESAATELPHRPTVGGGAQPLTQSGKARRTDRALSGSRRSRASALVHSPCTRSLTASLKLH